MSCDPERITAYVDGALDALHCPEQEAHLDACPTCRAQVDQERELRTRLKALPLEEPSPGLEARVRASLRPRLRPLRVLLPLAAGLAALVFWARGAAPLVAWELSRDHDHCFGERRLPAQVWSSDPARIADWFEGRGTAVPMIPAVAGGLEVVGARYCSIVDRRVAHVYYTNGDHRLSLFLVPGSVHNSSREMRVRGNFVRILRVGGATVGLVSEEEASIEAFERALTTTVARNAGPPPPAPGR